MKKITKFFTLRGLPKPRFFSLQKNSFLSNVEDLPQVCLLFDKNDTEEQLKVVDETALRLNENGLSTLKIDDSRELDEAIKDIEGSVAVILFVTTSMLEKCNVSVETFEGKLVNHIGETCMDKVSIFNNDKDTRDPEDWKTSYIGYHFKGLLYLISDIEKDFEHTIRKFLEKLK